MSPCQVSGLSSVPAPSSKTGFRCRYAGAWSRPRRARAPQRAIGECITHRGPERGPVRWRKPVVVNPAGQFPLAPRRPEGQIDAAILRREVVHRPSESESLTTAPSAKALVSSPGRDVVRRVRTASSASDSSIESTAPSRRTTPATDSDPTGSSSCLSSRQASACSHVTETLVEVLMPQTRTGFGQTASCSANRGAPSGGAGEYDGLLVPGGFINLLTLADARDAGHDYSAWAGTEPSVRTTRRVGVAPPCGAGWATPRPDSRRR